MGKKETEAIVKFAEKLIVERIKNFPGICILEIFELKEKKKKKKNDWKNYLGIMKKLQKKKYIYCDLKSNDLFYKRKYYVVEGFNPDQIIDKYEECKLFEETIYPGLTKLADALIKRYNLKGEDPNDDLKDEFIDDAISKITRMDETRGSAFSFFNMCGNNFLRAYLAKKERSVRIKPEISGGGNSSDNNIVQDEYAIEQKDNEVQEQLIDCNFEAAGEQGEFVKLIKENMGKYCARSQDKEEKAVVQSILVMLDNVGLMDIYNKKDALSVIRTITELETREITKHLKVFKKVWQKTYADYYGIEMEED